VVLLVAPLPFPRRHGVAIRWAHFNLWWLRVTCGVRHVLEGREQIPEDPAVVLAKHQSTWETMALGALFRPQSWVLKRELLRIPFFGWGLALMRPIAIDRSAGRRAVQQVVEQGRRRLAEGSWVIVFPEGTRVAAGEAGRYRVGGALLAVKAGVPVVPVAHNAGRFWPRHGFRKRPGTIRLVVGPPIPTGGRRAEDVLAEARAWIEGTVQRIDEEASEFSMAPGASASTRPTDAPAGEGS
jgi:1-acyl-sn-glycerol-3-phosphate acyltransferase